MENEQVLISWSHLRILKAYPANHRPEELKQSWGNGASLTVFMASECYILEAQEKVNLVLIHNIPCRKTHIGLKLSSLSRTLIYSPSENLQTCSMLVQWNHQLVLPSQLFKLIYAPSQSLCCILYVQRYPNCLQWNILSGPNGPHRLEGMGFIEPPHACWYLCCFWQC